MQSDSYWTKKHYSRRRFLLTSGAAASAAFILACGGDDESGDGIGATGTTGVGGSTGSGGSTGPGASTGASGATGTGASGLLTAPTDTSSEARRGGTVKRNATGDPAHLDAHGGGASVAMFYEIAYSRLFSYVPGHLEPSQDEIEGAIAEEWEWSPDRLTLTAKLRPNVNFHDLPPVNGRAMDVDDVLFSWERFSTQGSNRAVVANSVNPEAPVISITAPDQETVVIQFKEPLVYGQAYLAQRGYLSIVPKEAEDENAIDLRQRMIGTGPFLLSDYTPSVGLTFQRHEGYWDQERPYIDQVDFPIISEYSARLAQFRAGSIHWFEINQDDVLQTKQDLSDLLMYEGDLGLDTRRTVLGWQDENLRDERVRQALSMSIERDPWIEAQYNVEGFRSAGLPVTTRWNTALEASDANTGWWLDPKGDEFGENAKYYHRDLEEAKKLLAAAGHADGVELQSNHFTSGQHGADFVTLIELFESMASEAGFRFSKNLINYDDYLNNFRDSNGMFSGVTYKLGPPAPSGDPVARLTYEFSTAGGIGFHGFDSEGNGNGSGDPHVEAELAKARGNFDFDERRQIVHDLQRYLAKAMYNIRWPGGATEFSLVWPAVRNFRVFRPGTQQENVLALSTWWLDE